jgi:protoheme IX farnesyltransferase
MKAATLSTAVSPLKLRDYWALSKPRVTLLVWLTTLAGMVLAGSGWSEPRLLIAMLAASWFVIASANAFNQVFERKYDSLMKRTANRPLPSGRLSVSEGFAAGSLWGAAGIALLAVFVNWQTAVLGIASILLYVAAYTPLKRKTHLATAVGAIPGAIPPLAGWVAVRGTVDAFALVLFAIQFVWQFPHFWAIAWLLREDYAAAGFRMLPFPGATGQQAGLCALQFTLPLFPLNAFVALGIRDHVAAICYVIGAFILSAWMARASWRFWKDPSDANAKSVIKVSVLYLPLLLLLMIVWS